MAPIAAADARRYAIEIQAAESLVRQEAEQFLRCFRADPPSGLPATLPGTLQALERQLECIRQEPTVQEPREPAKPRRRHGSAAAGLRRVTHSTRRLPRCGGPTLNEHVDHAQQVSQEPGPAKVTDLLRQFG